MWLARQLLVVAMTLALATYALDCLGVTTPEQAMQCCNSMRCPSHHHSGQDCCRTMPAMHAAIGQPTSINSISPSLFVHGAVLPSAVFESINSSVRLIRERSSHGPPRLLSRPVLTLRI